MSSSYLWNKETTVEYLKMATEFITHSIHHIDDRRVNHLAAWVHSSNYPMVSLKFIETNINCRYFNPFANPWSDEINNIFNKSLGTKLLRLSTRVPGELTLSNIEGIHTSQRFKVTPEGIIFGNFKFKNTAELMTHMNRQECCFCIESINKEDAVVLKCGHIFHKNCIDLNHKYSKQCPLCKKLDYDSFRIPSGEACMYTTLELDPID